MEGDSLFDLLKVCLKLVLQSVFLLDFQTLVDTIIAFANKVLSMLLCVLGFVVSCLLHEGSDKMGKMRKNDPVPKELKLRPWL